ncbi:MAG: trypsin-like peptidase domain-containing protein [Flavipsychrobacter sp.]
MSIDNNHIWNLAEAYAAGTMPEAEKTALLSRLQTDVAFAAEFHECVNMLRSLEGSGRQAQFRTMLQDVHQEVAAKPTRSIPLRAHYWRTAAIAAGIALLTSFTTYWSFNRPDRPNVTQYNVLRREIENIKRSQNQLIQNIKTTNNSAPALPARYTGTGFALTNDGYLVTDYHVVDGADSVYIQNSEGHYFKASVKASDPKNDIAILKVQDSKFRFGKTDVPYTFAPTKSGLGARIYTLGFPEDEIIYNEGYISAKNGYEGDSMQYRLELPADPGQSGAPVLDKNGNVLAIITAKGNRDEGNTYAVSSKAVLQLMHSIRKDLTIRLPKNNKLTGMEREAQIQKLEHYTCSVKVYKK